MSNTKRNKECKQKMNNFFEKVIAIFRKVAKDAAAFLDETIPVAIEFVQVLKTVVDNPAMDIVTALIPSNIDDVTVKILRANLGKVIDLLQLQITCKTDNVEEKIACYLEYLRHCSPELRNALYHKTAALLTKLNSGNHAKKFTDAEIDALVQIAYTKFKSGK